MQNSMRNLGLSLLCFISLSVFAQSEKHKERPFKIHRFGEEKESSRGIWMDENTAYLATSTGELLAVSLDSIHVLNLLKGKKPEELRDVAKFENHVLAMQSGKNGVIYCLKNAGKVEEIQPSTGNWQGVFLDGMDFYDSTGFLMGDPIDGYFSLYFSIDQGLSWQKSVSELKANDGEAGFAASGTNVQVLNDSTFIFVSGGSRSRFFKSSNQGATWKFVDLPFDTLSSSGPFSVHFTTPKKGIIVGGDYTKPNDASTTSFYTEDGGKTWKKSKKQCNGYRSCVTSNGKIAFACGSNGIDFSKNNGKTWQPFALTNCLALTIVGNKLFATTAYGCVLEYDIP